MSNITILYVGSDNVIEVAGLQNELSGAFLNSVTVTVTLKDAAGSNVTGDSWPKTMTYLTGSNGVYRATLGYALSLTAGIRYTATIAANGGAGLRAQWDIECIARSRN